MSNLKKILTIAFILCFVFPHQIKAFETCFFINSKTGLIEKTIVFGFNKSFLKTCNSRLETIPKIESEIELNLSRKDIDQLGIKPKKKPFGFRLFDNTYLRPRVSVNYLRDIMENINEVFGLYSNGVQEDLDEKFGKTEDNITEGGLEISCYF